MMHSAAPTGMTTNASRQSIDDSDPPRNVSPSVTVPQTAPKTPMAPAIRPGGVTTRM